MIPRAFTSVDECLHVLTAGATVSDEPDVDVLQHSLQCGAILRREHPDDLELSVAGLLHDISDAATPGDHRAHDERGAALVAPLFGPRVARLVGAHVIAKRYLVTREPRYRERLSARSAQTLQSQGDALDDEALTRLAADPDLDAILALRRADERAKDPTVRVPDLESWRAALEHVAGSD
jgi:predicted HD phosphohydrolase